MSKFNQEEEKFLERQRRLNTIIRNMMAKCGGDDSNCTTGPLDRYFISSYTDGPSTRWNVIDRQTQEWVRRFPTKGEAAEYAAALSLSNGDRV